MTFLSRRLASFGAVGSLVAALFVGGALLPGGEAYAQPGKDKKAEPKKAEPKKAGQPGQASAL